MGSSVFHGGFSTFVAISVLSPSKTYIFVVFFRLWFGIILFGMMNGFILLPVLLTFIGPTHAVAERSTTADSEEKQEQSQDSPCKEEKKDNIVLEEINCNI